MITSFKQALIYFADFTLALCIFNQVALAEKSLDIFIGHTEPIKREVTNAQFNNLLYNVTITQNIKSFADLDALNYKIDFVILHKNKKVFDDSISRIVDLILSKDGNLLEISTNTGTTTKGISPWSISSTVRSSKSGKNGEFIVSTFALIGHGDVGNLSRDPAVEERINKGEDGVINTKNGKILIINIGNVVVTTL